MNRQMCSMQKIKEEIAFEGTDHPEANNWFTKLVVSAYEMADEIMLDSAEDNALRTAYISIGETGTPIPQAELMGEKTIYGTLQGVGISKHSQGSSYVDRPLAKSESDTNLLYGVDDATSCSNDSVRSKKQEEALGKARSRRQRKLVTPGEKKGILRRWAGRLGLDFVVSGIKFANRQIDNAVDGVLIRSNVSSTGFRE
ncbi:unnamed protein product [Pseudo-nitzschia multistriata]|uniref:Uncharacterized protein n=1 Tax=Pseudo-nitzschia multistriata TaxID=183589 RepID=A0A448YV16_9STRA|nr:unnamed protein product [Pseudo-nitzschia multistriata]